MNKTLLPLFCAKVEIPFVWLRDSSTTLCFGRNDRLMSSPATPTLSSRAKSRDLVNLSLSSRQGFTLVETVIAAAIFAIVAVAGTFSLTSVARSISQQRIIINTSKEAENIIDTISRQVRSADKLYFVNTNSDHFITINIPSFPDAQRHVKYELVDSKIKKNNADFSGNDVIITEFTLTGLASHTNEALTSTNELSNKPFVNISITVQSSKKLLDGSSYSIQMKTSVTPRNWNKTYTNP